MTTGSVVNKMTIYFVGELIRSSDFYGNEKTCDETIARVSFVWIDVDHTL
jgi:hypothetical protein